MTQLWTTDFSTPAAPTTLAVSVDDETSWITLSWDAWAGDPALLEEWRVYRTDGAGDRIRIDDSRATDPDDPSFVDYDAPWGAGLSYDVVAYDGATESEPATIGAEIGAIGPYLVAPGDGSASWSPIMVPGGRRLPRRATTVHTPLGRTTYLATSGVVRRPAGSASFAIEWADIADLARFRRLDEYANENEYVVWKPAAGETYRVQLVGMAEDGPGVNGYGISFDWYTVV